MLIKKYWRNMLVYVVFSVIFGTILAGDLPSYFPTCSIDDSELNKCIKKAAETLKPNLRTGIPELNIPPMDPLFLPEVSLQQSTAAINYKMKLVNMTIHGFGNYIVKEFSYDRKSLAFHGTLSFDSLSFTSDFSIDGKLLALPLYGTGKILTYLGESTGSVSTTAKLTTRNGEEYYDPLSVKAKITISDYNSTLEGLFNGNDDLSRATNKVINENSQELLKEILPAIEKVAEELVHRVMLGITKRVPYKKLFPSSH